MKHTKGEWQQDGLKIVGNGYAIATVNSHKTTEGSANAKLIAAAPELLEALQKLVRAIDRMPSNPVDGLADDARAVIAKAIGENKK